MGVAAKLPIGIESFQKIRAEGDPSKAPDLYESKRMMHAVYGKKVILLIDEYFGFSDREVMDMLRFYGLEQKYELIKEWYDGYRFGDADVYCPWDIINLFIDQVMAWFRHEAGKDTGELDGLCDAFA